MPDEEANGAKEARAFHLESPEHARLAASLPTTEPEPAPAIEGPILSEEVPGQRSQLFTVRMWPEPLGDGRAEWRGKVEHVTSGEGYAFREWARLIACLERWCSVYEKGENDDNRCVRQTGWVPG